MKAIVSRRLQRFLRKVPAILLMTLITLIYVYPFFWLFISSSKTNAELFGNALGMPAAWDWSYLPDVWNSVGNHSYTTFFVNTFKLVFPVVLFTLLSALLVAYGFARFHFFGKRFFFTLMLSTMMLPATVVMIPRYMMFNQLNWINTYAPLIVPYMFGGSAFFIYLLVQFIRGIPGDLDEAARIDGCSSFQILIRIILPLSVPALFSAGVFQFMWTWNDFFNQMLYINSVSKYTISLALKMSLDTTTNVAWGQLFAMCIASIIPPFVLFFFTQRYLVEGIATTGLK